MPPLASIIIPAYNVDPWIGDTLRSVVSQSMDDWECIVVDDGSTDGTADMVASFHDARIRLIRQNNAGVSAARNKGLDNVLGRYVLFLDGDDLWHERAVERLLEPLTRAPECVLSWADFVRFEDKTNRELPMPGTRRYHTGNIWHDMLVDSFMQFGALCARAAVAKSLRFDATLRIGEDRDWLLRLLKGRKAVYVPEVVHYYRQRSNSAVRDLKRFFDDEEKMLLPHLNDPDAPARVRRRALSALGFHQAVLLAKSPGRRMDALWRLLSAISCDPFYCENYWRIVRKLWFTLRSARYVSLPDRRMQAVDVDQPYKS